MTASCPATANGDLDIGIAEGTAAWLEVHTAFGQMRNLLDATGRPAETDETVEVRAAPPTATSRSAGPECSPRHVAYWIE